jgi:pseudouridine synthase
MHPRFEVEKEYLVKLKGKLDQSELQKAMRGVFIDGAPHPIDKITLSHVEGPNAWYQITIHEGKNRMIRKVAEAISHPVIALRRVRIGPVKLGSLRPGQSRHLTQKEISFFLRYN